jgi:hypothetical protein
LKKQLQFIIFSSTILLFLLNFGFANKESIEPSIQKDKNINCGLNLVIVDSVSNKPINNAKIEYLNFGGSTITLYTGTDGLIFIQDIITEHEYSFVVNSSGFKNKTVSFFIDVCDSEPSKLEIQLEKIEK